MTQKMARIFSLGICLLLLLGIFSWPKPVSAGLSVWSAETIPTRLNEVLGRAGIDVRDLSIGSDYQTIYAAPGNSAGGNFVYKSTDGGAKWTEYATAITADLVAVAPDNNNLAVIANSTTAAVHISFDGGATWQTMGTVQETPGGAAAAAIYDIKNSRIRIFGFLHFFPVPSNHTTVVFHSINCNASGIWNCCIECVVISKTFDCGISSGIKRNNALPSVSTFLTILHEHIPSRKLNESLINRIIPIDFTQKST